MTAPASLALPPRLDLSTAAVLAEDLRALRGSDLVLDAGPVTHLGTPGLQVLLAAVTSWAAAGHTLSLANVPEGLEDQLVQFGLHPADLTTEAMADEGGGAQPEAGGAEASPASGPPDPAIADAASDGGQTTEETQP